MSLLDLVREIGRINISISESIRDVEILSTADGGDFFAQSVREAHGQLISARLTLDDFVTKGKKRLNVMIEQYVSLTLRLSDLIGHAHALADSLPGNIVNELEQALQALYDAFNELKLGRPFPTSDRLAPSRPSVPHFVHSLTTLAAEMRGFVGSAGGAANVSLLRSALESAVRVLTACIGVARSPLEVDTSRQGVTEPVMWALRAPLIATAFLAAEADPAAWFICRKTKLAQDSMNRSVERHDEAMGEYRLFEGRLFGTGPNVSRQFDSMARGSWTMTPCWVRLPAVSKFETYLGSQAAVTARGLYVWGSNVHNKFGLVTREEFFPTRRLLSSTAVDVAVGAELAFIKDIPGDGGPPAWHVMAGEGQGWVRVDSLDGAGVTRITCCEGVSFAFTDDGQLLTAGDNEFGQLGRPAPPHDPTFAPVDLPAAFAPHRARCSSGSVFVTDVDGRCLAWGQNECDCLGLGDSAPDLDTVPAPLELPFPVTSVISSGASSVFISDGHILMAGDNTHHLCPFPAARLHMPTEVIYPWPVARIATGWGSMFVMNVDGMWFALGNNAMGKLGVGSAAAVVPSLVPLRLPGITWILPGEFTTFFMTPSDFFIAGDVSDGGTFTDSVGRPATASVPEKMPPVIAGPVDGHHGRGKDIIYHVPHMGAFRSSFIDSGHLVL